MNPQAAALWDKMKASWPWSTTQWAIVVALAFWWGLAGYGVFLAARWALGY